MKSLNKISLLKSEWKRKWKEDIADIFMFGSSVRGKGRPNDVDLCLIFRNNVDLNIVEDVESLCGDGYHVSSLVVDNFFTRPHSLSKTMLIEGKSILSGKHFAEVFGLNPMALYSYDLSAEAPTKKVKIVQLLRGRKSSEGLVKNLGGTFISNSSFTIPMEKDNEIKEALDSWKVKYKRSRVLLMD